ncbi:MAG: MGMT family protein [archaeon]
MELRFKISEHLKTLKKGKTTTYKALAKKFNSHPRAVARILATNKDKSVPCYKVIRSDGKLGGYNGLLGRSKGELLGKESRCKKLLTFSKKYQFS